MNHGLERHNILRHHLQVGFPQSYHWPVNGREHYTHPQEIQSSTGLTITTCPPYMDDTNIRQPSTIIPRTQFLSTPRSQWHPPTSIDCQRPPFIFQSHRLHHGLHIRHIGISPKQRDPIHSQSHHPTPLLFSDSSRRQYPFCCQKYAPTCTHLRLLSIRIWGTIPRQWILLSHQQTTILHQQKWTIFTTRKCRPAYPIIHHQICSTKCNIIWTRRPIF